MLPQKVVRSICVLMVYLVAVSMLMVPHFVAAQCTNCGTTSAQPVNWSIFPVVGSISTSGLYTAPATITSNQTITITATSIIDGTITGTAQILLRPRPMTIAPTSVTLYQNGTQQFSASGTPVVLPTPGPGGTPAPVAIALSPITVSLNENQTKQFTATVTGATDTTKVWSISPSTGTVSSTGLYTAPAVISSPTTVTLTVKASADLTKLQTAAISLVGSGALVNTAPLTITTSQTIDGVKITNPGGHCINVSNATGPVIIRNSELGPCQLSGVRISGSSNITVQNVYIHDTGKEGVTPENSSNLTITQNRMERNSSGVYALNVTGINVNYNRFLNPQGPPPRGQFVQFDKVYGTGNKIRCNSGQNIFGQGTPEDNINIYQSNGDPADPILIEGNRILGGGPSNSGGGILVGDDGGSYTTVKSNILVNPGQYGLSIASGHHQVMDGNKVFAIQAAWTNVGLSIWNQYPHPCNSVTAQNNRINWINSAGARNDAWDAGNCGVPGGWSTNTFNDGTLDANIINDAIAACP